MTITELLKRTEHRPWSIPTEKWKYYQEWNNAVFLHWQVDIHELQKCVPIDLEIDLFDGKPWISLVAFTMEKIRHRNMPAFSPISNFDEINIRTYVKKNNKSGVYFLSIEAGNHVSCMIAKAISELPYRYSNIKREKNIYSSENLYFNDKMKIDYEIKKKLEDKSEIDTWLTERYSLFQDTSTKINEFDIHHIEWPTYEINLKSIDIQYPRFKNMLNNSPDIMHYSTGVQVLAWNKISTVKIG